MFDFFHKSLRNKLLISFIGVGFFPYLLFLVYTIFLSETKIVDKIVLEQFNRAEMVIKLMDGHIQALTKEVVFLSNLDLMDDILADDIDKRISRLLTQKANDYALDLTFLLLDPQSNVIASSDKERLQKKFIMKTPLNAAEGSYITDGKLYIYSKVFASFEVRKELGILVLEYDLQNLDSYLTHQENVHSYIINPKSGLTVGNEVPFKIPTDKEQDNVIEEDHLIVYKKMISALDEWYIVYAVDKGVALAFLYDFISFMLYVSPFIFIVIIYIAIRYSKYIVKPIQNLTTITDDIIKTGDYSSQLKVNTEDEIAGLTHSFNKMIMTTDKALKSLEYENRIRLQRFIQLIEIFNSIIQTKDESSCIAVSLAQLKNLTQIKHIYFKEERGESEKCIALYVTDFEKDAKVYFGSIELDTEALNDKYDVKFFNSIATMIMLQLDRIRLIDRTMSASRAKSAFISNMSHELRTPLNAIIGFAQYLITYEALSDEQQDIVSNVESSAQYLLGMINEILDIAKIEAGKMEARIEEVDILALVQSVYAMLQPLANDKDLDFELISSRFEQKLYRTDPKMFKQIVVNLLSNAIKFTKKGSITLELSVYNKEIIVTIKDSGTGISKEDLKQLFNDFTQVENVMQKKHTGTGLGLSLSKKIAHILGGDVWLESRGPGYGTTAIFSLKIEGPELLNNSGRVS